MTALRREAVEMLVFEDGRDAHALSVRNLRDATERCIERLSQASRSNVDQTLTRGRDEERMLAHHLANHFCRYATGCPELIPSVKILWRAKATLRATIRHVKLRRRRSRAKGRQPAINKQGWKSATNGVLITIQQLSPKMNAYHNALFIGENTRASLIQRRTGQRVLAWVRRAARAADRLPSIGRTSASPARNARDARMTRRRRNAAFEMARANFSLSIN